MVFGLSYEEIDVLLEFCVRFLIVLISALILTAIPSYAEIPKRIKSTKKLKNGQGVVLLSVRSQAVQSERLRIWFLREGGDETNENDVLLFTRVQGFGGPSMIDSLPKTYAIAAGRYKLLAHMVGCGDSLPPEGQVCATSYANIGSSIANPTGRYVGSVPSFSVEEGMLTNAGEFILEWPKIGKNSMPDPIQHPLLAKIRWKPLDIAKAKKLATLPSGSTVEIPKEYQSNIQCEDLKKGLIKPTVHPFEC